MKKTLQIAKKAVVWLVVAIAVCMMLFTVVSVLTFNRSNRSLFGCRAFIVLSDSMSKTDFSAGDLVLVKQVDPITLRPEDIIAYTSQNPSNFGETVTHKIRSLTTTSDGQPGFITYGTTTDTDDESIVTYPYVLGKYQTHFAGVGTFFQFLKTPLGYVLCILTPFLILIGMEVRRCILLFRQYREEQKAELQAERDQLAAERAETQRMIQELQQMKEQLAPQNIVSTRMDEVTQEDKFVTKTDETATE